MQPHGVKVTKLSPSLQRFVARLHHDNNCYAFNADAIIASGMS